MKASSYFTLAIILGVLMLFSGCAPTEEKAPEAAEEEMEEAVFLPSPQFSGDYSVEESISERASRRDFTGEPLSLEMVSQVLWAAQGRGADMETGATRTVPSAGGTYPLEVYLIAGEIDDLETGIYRHLHFDHGLEKVVTGEDLRNELAEAALGQGFIAEAPATIVLVADFDRTTSRYRERGIRYVHMEVGHATQNIYLQCEALGLGTVAVGAFSDEEVMAILDTEYDPLMIVPFGK